MAPSCTQDSAEDDFKLEPKVVLALSRLSKSRKTGKATGVSCRQVVQYLMANYCGLDGDIESQVITALLSCVKTGTVCALDNGKYLLPATGPRGIVSQCFARASHGPKCSCLTTLKHMSRNFQKSCCSMKLTPRPAKRTKASAPRPKSCPRQKKTRSRSKRQKCAQKAQKMLDARKDYDTNYFDEADSKCSYCLEIHTIRRNSTPRLCDACHPLTTGFVAPYDTFSPREELT